MCATSTSWRRRLGVGGLALFLTTVLSLAFGVFTASEASATPGHGKSRAHHAAVVAHHDRGRHLGEKRAHDDDRQAKSAHSGSGHTQKTPTTGGTVPVTPTTKPPTVTKPKKTPPPTTVPATSAGGTVSPPTTATFASAAAGSTATSTTTTSRPGPAAGPTRHRHSGLPLGILTNPFVAATGNILSPMSLRSSTSWPLPIVLLAGAGALLFLLVQGRIDRRDPKLVRAPEHSDEHTIGFD